MSLRDDLKAYLDGELSPLRMAEMREAVDRDPELARELRELQAISEAVKAHAPQFDPTGLDQTLRALNKRKVLDQRVTWPLGIALTGIFAAIIFPVFSRAKSAAKAPMYARNTEATTAAPLETNRFDAVMKSPAATGAASAEMAKARRDERDQEGDRVKALAKAPVAERMPMRSQVERLSPSAAGTPAAKPQQPAKATDKTDSPIVVVADSVEKAREKVAVLAPYFDGRVLTEHLTEGKSGEVAMVLEIPVSKASEAVEVIKDVVSVPARPADSKGDSQAARKASDAEEARAPGGGAPAGLKEPPRDGGLSGSKTGFGGGGNFRAGQGPGGAGGLGGGAGGFGGGGVGGFGGFDGNKASGAPGTVMTGPRKAMPDVAQMRKREVKGPVRKIVIVIRRRPKGTNDKPTPAQTPPLKPIPSPGNL